MVRIALSTDGAGRNARAGIRPCTRSSNHGAQAAAKRPPPASRSAASRWSTTTARTSPWASVSRRRTSLVPIPYGALDTTEKRSAGNGTRSASPARTVTSPQPGACERSSRTHAWSSSTASTRAPRAATADVSAPAPAPRSTTSAPGGGCSVPMISATTDRSWRTLGRARGGARLAESCGAWRILEVMAARRRARPGRGNRCDLEEVVQRTHGGHFTRCATLRAHRPKQDRERRGGDERATTAAPTATIASTSSQRDADAARR